MKAFQSKRQEGPSLSEREKRSFSLPAWSQGKRDMTVQLKGCSYSAGKAIPGKWFRAGLPLVLGTLLFSSCWYPPFDPFISASVRAADKLGSPVAEYTFYGTYGKDKEFFCPLKYDNGSYYSLTQGVWVWKGENNYWHFQYVPDMGALTTLGNEDFFSLFTGDGGLPWFVQMGEKGTSYIGDPFSKIIYTINNTDPNNPYQLYKTPLAPSQLCDLILSVGFGNCLDPNNPAEEIGYVGVWYDEYGSSLEQKIEVFYFTIQPNISYSSLAIFSPPSEPPLSFWIGALPDTENTTPLYLSYDRPDGSEGVTYRLNRNEPNPSWQLLPIPYRLTRMLSTGDLVVDGDTKMFVYSPEGALKYVIPTEACRFIHEVWVPNSLGGGGHYEMMFSRTVRWKPSSQEQQQYGVPWEYRVSLYQIPTTELYRLAQ